MSGRTDAARERVFISLGGNLGDPAKAMAEALNALDSHDQVRLVAVSSLYRTPPWGVTDQPDFLNAAAELETELSPLALLQLCLEIERGLKREKRERWGPRVIDLDLIAFGDRVHCEEGLELPHPRFASRAFVLVPLAEIAGSCFILGKSLMALAEQADKTGIECIAGPQEWFWCKRQDLCRPLSGAGTGDRYCR